LDLFVDGRGFVHIRDVNEAVAEIGLQNRRAYGFSDRQRTWGIEALRLFRRTAWGS
jgi:hypothetical protein